MKLFNDTQFIEKKEIGKAGLGYTHVANKQEQKPYPGELEGFMLINVSNGIIKLPIYNQLKPSLGKDFSDYVKKIMEINNSYKKDFLHLYSENKIHINESLLNELKLNN